MIKKIWNYICYKIDPRGTSLKIDKKYYKCKHEFLKQKGYSLLKNEKIDDLITSQEKNNLYKCFEYLKENTIQDLLIKHGFKCIKDIYLDDITYDLEGVTTIELNNKFIKLDKDLEGLKNLIVLPKEKKIKIDSYEYILKTLQHQFYNDPQMERPEKGMIYLKLVNDYLSRNNIDKIAFLIHDTMIPELFGLIISNKQQFKYILILFKYLEELYENNRTKTIELAENEPYQLRGFELLTNYHGYNIQEGPMIHVVE